MKYDVYETCIEVSLFMGTFLGDTFIVHIFSVKCATYLYRKSQDLQYNS